VRAAVEGPLRVGRSGGRLGFVKNVACSSVGTVAASVRLSTSGACMPVITALIVYVPIFVNEITSPPSHLHLDQTDNFPQMLYSNLKMAELGRNI